MRKIIDYTIMGAIVVLTIISVAIDLVTIK